jgi:glycosyltransferase involved in cell wall biosynthesis
LKICIIIDDYLPHSIKIAAKMIHELAIEFHKNGHEVFIITPGIELKNRVETLTIDNINILYFKSGRIKNVGLVKRLTNEFLLSFKAYYFLKNYLIEKHCNLIIYYSPSIFWGIFVSWLRKKWNVSSYLILRDFFPQWVIDSGMIHNYSPITLFLKFFELINYNSADRIGIMSDANLKWFKTHYHKYRNIEVLHNWASNSELTFESKNESNNDLRLKYNLTNKVIFFYGGNIGHAQDMINLLILAEQMLPYKEAFFIFVGAGDEVELVKNSIARKSLINCLLLDAVNQETFNLYLKQVDVGLFTLHPNHKTHNFPGKILGYMQNKLPILGAVNEGNDLKQVIENSKSGFVSIAGDSEILFKNAIKLLDTKLRKLLGENANQLLNNEFSTKSAYMKIMKLVKNKNMDDNY